MYIFLPQVEVPPSTLRFYIITQWSCSTSGSLWKMPDSNPGLQPQKSSALPLSHHISPLSHHIFESYLICIWHISISAYCFLYRHIWLSIEIGPKILNINVIVLYKCRKGSRSTVEYFERLSANFQWLNI